MNETYTRDQVMERLGIKSRNAFKHLAKKYSEYFVLVQQGSTRFPRYNKAAVDRFAEIRASLKDQFHLPRPS
jgi:hypothetical protein